MKDVRRALFASTLLACSAIVPASAQNVSPDIKAIFDQPNYEGATWGLRVIDVESGRPIINLRPDHKFLSHRSARTSLPPNF